MGYVIGHNMPGYLPTAWDNPYVYDSADEAKSALIEEMLQDADSVDTFGGYAAHAEALSNAAEDLNLSDVSQGYSVIVCDPDREHDLGECYWIEVAEDLLPYDNPDSPEFWQR